MPLALRLCLRLLWRRHALPQWFYHLLLLKPHLRLVYPGSLARHLLAAGPHLMLAVDVCANILHAGIIVLSRGLLDLQYHPLRQIAGDLVPRRHHK